jgi:hypothetical protein
MFKLILLLDIDSPSTDIASAENTNVELKNNRSKAQYSKENIIGDTKFIMLTFLLTKFIL